MEGAYFMCGKKTLAMLLAAPDGTPFAYKSENQGLNRVFLLYYSTENTAYLITLDA